jgi:hypothetical protein
MSKEQLLEYLLNNHPDCGIKGKHCGDKIQFGQITTTEQIDEEING